MKSYSQTNNGNPGQIPQNNSKFVQQVGKLNFQNQPFKMAEQPKTFQSSPIDVAYSDNYNS